MRSCVLVFCTLGCAGAPDKGSADPPGSGAPDTASPADSPSDADLLQAAIDGEAEAEATLTALAASGGLPVETADGTFLFACLCGEGSWAVAGDHDDWAGVAMERTDDLWWAEVEVPEPDGSGYKFRNGDAWRADPQARRYRYDEFGELSLVRASTAHLERGYAAAGHGLEGRELRVFVPAGGAYTHLVVAHDGQNLFDPAAFHGGWRLDAAVGAAPILVVGIDNTAARIDEYTPTTDVLSGETMGGAADAYAAMVSEVRAAMEARYGEAERTALLGSSLGGLVSLAIADLQPGEWDAALSLSGTVGWGSIGTNGETILDRYAAAGHRDTALYIDSGGGGSCVDTDGDGLQDDAPDGSDNYCENRQLADQLAASGYTWEVDLWHWHEPGAPHTEAAWADRVHRPLEIFLGL